MSGVDPKDAGTVIDIAVEDLFTGPGQCPRQVIVVRVQHHLLQRMDALPQGTRVRPQPVVASRGTLRASARPMAAEHVVFAATYTRYEGTRIVRQLAPIFRNRLLVRISTVRALMKSVPLPAVKETVQFEEVL